MFGLNLFQGKLQKALISLGHFHAVMDEQLKWLDVVNRQMDEAPPVYGDPQLIEMELAKLKIIKIDMRNHQPSIDSVLEAGREVLLSEGGADARQTRERLEELNRKREAVLTKTRDRHMLLDDALRDVREVCSVAHYLCPSFLAYCSLIYCNDIY